MVKLLVVDDDPLIRESIAAVMDEDFDTIVEATDGVEAVEMAQRERPDLVLLDIMMPRLDGLQACARLRSLPELASTPVVILTARRSEDEARAAFAAGATDYMVKPFSIGQLRARLRTLALGRPAADEAPPDPASAPAPDEAPAG